MGVSATDFIPSGDAVTVAGTTTTANAAFPGTAVTHRVRCHNSGTIMAFARFGSGAQVATLNDVMIPPGVSTIDLAGKVVDNVAVIYAATGSGNLTFQRGQ